MGRSDSGRRKKVKVTSMEGKYTGPEVVEENNAISKDNQRAEISPEIKTRTNLEQEISQKENERL